MTNIDTSKTEYRYIENRISIHRKPNIDISKTEYRYIENRISIYRKPNIDISKAEYRYIEKTEYRYTENRISIYRNPNIDASTYPAPAMTPAMTLVAHHDILFEYYFYKLVMVDK